MHADPAKNRPYPAWHDYMSHARFAISAARPAIERAARAKALDDAAGRYTAGLMGDEWDVFDKARDAILALKDRA